MIVGLSLILLTSVLYVIVRWWYSPSGILYRNNKVPSPPEAGYILGHVYSAIPLYGEAGAIWFDKWSLTYPRCWKLRLGPYVEAVTCHPKWIKEIFNDKPAQKEHHYRFVRDWVGDGLLFSTGDKWFTRRKLLTPSFHFDILKGYHNTFNKTTNVFIDSLRRKEDEKVDIFTLTLWLTLDTILQCLLSYETNCQIKDDQYANLMYRITGLIVKRIYTPQLSNNFIYSLTKDGRKYRDLAKKFDVITRKIVLDRQKIHQERPEELSPQQDFLDILLSAKYDDGSKLTVDDVLEEANVFVFEGHDTTAAAISWSLYLLAKNPEYLEKCYNEVQSVFVDGSECVSLNQLNSLPFLSLCLKECLRFKCSVPYIGRELNNDLTIDGIFLPKGSVIHIIIDSLHRCEEFWDEPMVFRPERFLPENSKDRDPFCYLPFSAGSRNCIGQNFAVNELKISVAKVLYNFRVQVIDEEKICRLNALIQKPLNLFLKFTPRSDGDEIKCE